MAYRTYKREHAYYPRPNKRLIVVLDDAVADLRQHEFHGEGPTLASLRRVADAAEMMLRDIEPRLVEYAGEGHDYDESVLGDVTGIDISS